MNQQNKVVVKILRQMIEQMKIGWIIGQHRNSHEKFSRSVELDYIVITCPCNLNYGIRNDNSLSTKFLLWFLT